METAPQSRVFISLSKNHMAGLSHYYDMDHGFCITELNSNISGGDLHAYFNQWGNITMCDIKACPSSPENKLAFVMLSTKEEADRADWAGPHRIKGTECKVRRIVNLKVSGIYFS
uniref:RRM domain-containing protein n=1 Tax=Cyprinodon variegatus TaxID=28743 RepID=A0A3Q2CUJ0_CYPVA